MERLIRLKMCEDKNIRILVDGQEKHIIDQSRSISAEKIFEIIGFTPGSYYVVSSENECDVDKQVLEYFASLFTDIVSKINKIEAPPRN